MCHSMFNSCLALAYMEANDMFHTCNRTNTVELQWLEHPLNHENMFETGAVRANEC